MTCKHCKPYRGPKEPAYCDWWYEVEHERRYVPSFATNIAITFALARRKMRRPSDDPLDPNTWPEHLQPPEPLSLKNRS